MRWLFLSFCFIIYLFFVRLQFFGYSKWYATPCYMNRMLFVKWPNQMYYVSCWLWFSVAFILASDHYYYSSKCEESWIELQLKRWFAIFVIHHHLSPVSWFMITNFDSGLSYFLFSTIIFIYFFSSYSTLLSRLVFDCVLKTRIYDRFWKMTERKQWQNVQR